MEAYKGRRGTNPLTPNFGTGWRWVVNFTPWPLYPQGKDVCVHCCLKKRIIKCQFNIMYVPCYRQFNLYLFSTNCTLSSNHTFTSFLSFNLPHVSATLTRFQGDVLAKREFLCLKNSRWRWLRIVETCRSLYCGMKYNLFIYLFAKSHYTLTVVCPVTLSFLQSTSRAGWWKCMVTSCAISWK
jgi:hypothetical protein